MNNEIEIRYNEENTLEDTLENEENTLGSQLEVNLSPTFIKRIKLSFNIWETSKATITCK